MYLYYYNVCIYTYMWFYIHILHAYYEVKVKVKSLSVVSNSMWPHGLYSLWNSPGQNTGVGSLSLLHGIVPTQGPNPCLPHCKQILYQLSHKRSPRILEWIAYPFSRGSSWPRNPTMVSCIAGGFFTNWAIREAPIQRYNIANNPKAIFIWHKSVFLYYSLAEYFHK